MRIPKHMISLAVGSALVKANRANTDANADLVRKELGRDEENWTQENLAAVIQKLGTKLALPRRSQKPFPRDVSMEELGEILKRFLYPNTNVEDCYENGELFATVFLTDPRISPERNQEDVLLAIKICNPRFKRVPPAPPPAPPSFPDEDANKPLINGMPRLPLNASEAVQRSAKLIQNIDLIDRLRKKEKWDREHQ